MNDFEFNQKHFKAKDLTDRKTRNRITYERPKSFSKNSFSRGTRKRDGNKRLFNTFARVR